MEILEIKVSRCKDCPLFSKYIDDSEYCSISDKPESRYEICSTEVRIKDIPDNCPLKDEEIIIKLIS